MAADTRQIDILVSLGVDRAWAEQSVRRVREMRDEIEALRRSVEKPAQAGVMDTLKLPTARDLQQLQESAAIAAGTADGTSGGSTGRGAMGINGLRRTGSALSQLGLPEIGGAVSRMGDLAQVAKEFDQIGKSLQGATAAGNAATGGFAALEAGINPVIALLGGVALGFEVYTKILARLTDEQERAKKMFEATLATQEEYYDFVLTATTKEAQGKLGQLQQQHGGLEEAAKENQTAVAIALADAESKGAITKGATLDQLQSLVGPFGDTFRTLKGQVDKTNAALTLNEALQGRIEGGLKSNAFAMNDAKAAQDAATKSLIAGAEGRVAVEREEAGYINLTTAAAKTRLSGLKDEQEALLKERGTLLNSGDTSDKVKEKIAGLNTALANNAEKQQTLANTAMPLIAAREAETEAIKALEQINQKYTSALQQLARDEAQITSAMSDRAKTLRRRDEQDAIDAQRDQVTKSYESQILAAKQNEAVSKLDSDYMASELKAVKDFREQEARDTAQANKERLRLLEDADLDLQDLASRGDVAGFVRRKQQAEKDLKRQAEDADDAAKERAQAYLAQRTEARNQYQEQLNLLRTSGDQRNSEAARLEQEFNNIREQWRLDDMARQRAQEAEDFNERMAEMQFQQSETLALVESYYQQERAAIVQVFAGAGDASQNDPSQVYTDPGPDGTTPISRFAGGLPFVPRDFYPAYLDRGERVLTAAENREYSHGGGGRGNTYNISVSAIVGDVATKSLVEESVNAIVDGTKQAFVKARGQGVA